MGLTAYMREERAATDMRPRKAGQLSQTASTQIVRDKHVGAFAQERFAVGLGSFDCLVAIVAQDLRARRSEVERNRTLVFSISQNMNAVSHADRRRNCAVCQIPGGRE